MRNLNKRLSFDTPIGFTKLMYPASGRLLWLGYS
jgi:hypothetical protein